MSQGSYLQNNKRKKHQYDDAGYEETAKPKKNKPKKDFSRERQNKRGEFV